MNILYYTGVGSRDTPGDILNIMRDFGASAARRGWVLRSGAADGADQAFEEGHRSVKCSLGMDCEKYGTCYAKAHNVPAQCGAPPRPEIYLPWPKFNGHSSAMHLCHDDPAFEIAATVHPRWSKLSPPVKNLHARNVYQVLGRDLATPSSFLVCWTPDGCESGPERTEFTGGTGTAIELAWRHSVPVFNLANKGRLSMLAGLLQVSAH